MPMESLETLEPPDEVARTFDTSADRNEARVRAIIERENKRQQRGFVTRLGRMAIPAAVMLGLLMVWEFGANFLKISEFLLPRPTIVAEELVSSWTLLTRHAGITLVEIVGGFVLAVGIGIPLAVAITYSRIVEAVIHPLLVAAQTIPKVALAPILVVWLGFGLAPKLLVAFLIAFFPVVISTIVGLRSTQPEMLHLVRSMGASAWQKFWMIRFPAALPSIFGGLKVAMTLAVVGALVGEFVGASSGLGYLIQIARGNLDSPLLFASITLISVIGVVLFLGVDLLERRVLRWHVSTRLEEIAGTM